MAFLAHKCPHPNCLTENISLTVAAVSPWNDRVGILHLLCPRCRLPSGAKIEQERNTLGIAQIQSHPSEITDLGYKVTEFWPQQPEPTIPELIPPDVARVYLQAERNFPTAGNEEAAGTMYRKALDVGFKKIDPNLKGMLGPKINALAKAGLLTQDIAVWSDHVRDIGNDAAHEEDPITREELTTLRNFSEMVLRYLFSLPNAVKKRRGEKLDWETEPTA
jgi:hypothetical protein